MNSFLPFHIFFCGLIKTSLCDFIKVMEMLNLGDLVGQPYGTHRHYSVNDLFAFFAYKNIEEYPFISIILLESYLLVYNCAENYVVKWSMDVCYIISAKKLSLLCFLHC